VKYFTPDLITRFGSPDDRVADAADAEWERAIRRYHRRLAKIRDALPPGWRRLRDARLALHDARVLVMGEERDTFLIVLELPSAQDLVVLTFSLGGEPVIDQAALQGEPTTGPACWLYEEFDLDRKQGCLFEVLLSNGWSVRLPFRNLDFLLTRTVLTSVNGAGTVRDDASVSRSA
jgi:hypothetical protein